MFGQPATCKSQDQGETPCRVTVRPIYRPAVKEHTSSRCGPGPISEVAEATAWVVDRLPARRCKVLGVVGHTHTSTADEEVTNRRLSAVKIECVSERCDSE